VALPLAGGTWVFSGLGVVGNYFYLTTLGPHVITVYYTDANGCTGSTTITINVIYCCPGSCQVNAGNDTTICAGSTVVLNASGCSGNISWFKITAAGAEQIGQENGIGVSPTQSTCYFALCCCQVGAIVCCDTDTICINVKPVP